MDQCCCPALPSLTRMSISAGRGWMLELGLQRSEPGRGLGLAMWRQTGERARIQYAHGWNAEED